MPRARRDFDSMVTRPLPAGCWLWEGYRNQDGYGIYGHHQKAHRFAWEREYGVIPVGMAVLHRCDVPWCVNPAHLFLGTLADNNRDRQLKGRSRGLFPAGLGHPASQRKGEKHWSARLSDAQVSVIRERRANGATITALASEFGVHHATISRISRGIWRSA